MPPPYRHATHCPAFGPPQTPGHLGGGGGAYGRGGRRRFFFPTTGIFERSVLLSLQQTGHRGVVGQRVANDFGRVDGCRAAIRSAIFVGIGVVASVLLLSCKTRYDDGPVHTGRC